VPGVIPLESEAARDPALAGGKAAALARLWGRQLRIPRGFVVTTAAYDAFVATHGLDAAIRGVLAEATAGGAPAIDRASSTIRALFRDRPLPATLEAEIGGACARLASPLVAVRSSATAEDLPAFSFAGQQDSFLNVAGTDAVLRAVVDCWSSLWSPRAMAYRARHGAAAGGALDRLSMAVLVQAMVPAEYAGVLFTANPVTGARDQIVIEAVRGLGDALVSGRVQPDRFVFDRDLRLLDHDGAAVPEAIARRAAPLAATMKDIAGAPQDLEWACTASDVFLLQARPITSLYPLPGDPLASTRAPIGGGLRAYVSFGAIQGMLDPMTPLGRDTIRGIFSGAQNLFGFGVTADTERVLVTAGERLWLDVTPLAAHRLGRRLLALGLSIMEPGAGAIVRDVVVPRIGPGTRRIRVATALRAARVFGPMAMRLAAAMIAPDWSRRRALGYLDRIARGAAVSDEPLPMLRALWHDAFPTMIPHLVPRIAAGVICQRAIGRLVRDLPDGEAAALLVSRGAPHNVTTDMNRALWALARDIRTAPDLRAIVGGRDAADLAVSFLDGRLPAGIAAPMTAFLDRYGARGLAEIDLGRPRWSEDPAPVFQILQTCVRAGARAPGAGIDGGDDADRRVADWARELRSRRGGWLRARLVVFLYRRSRALTGLREGPKFSIMRRFAQVRRALRQTGAALARAGTIVSADDVFFLHVRELDTHGGDGDGGWRATVRERQARYRAELHRAAVPLVLLGDGHAFFGAPGAAPAQGEATTGAALQGTPVSPGVAEGVVHVLDHPSRDALAPGEILVCRGTDPAWTPLFLAAAGLVTEVGGVMSHGAIVARECGLPAVVGVAGATRHLRTGQRVRIDGGSGRIVVVMDAQPGPSEPASPQSTA
jgi:pyruvate,water dikinase